MYVNGSVRVSYARRKPYERSVQNGLSVTPAEMFQAAKEGIPIAASQLSQASYDNTPQDDFYVPLDCRRGIDINDMFSAKMTGKEKVKTAKQKLDSQSKTE